MKISSSETNENLEGGKMDISSIYINLYARQNQITEVDCVYKNFIMCGKYE